MYAVFFVSELGLTTPQMVFIVFTSGTITNSSVLESKLMVKTFMIVFGFPNTYNTHVICTEWKIVWAKKKTLFST